MLRRLGAAVGPRGRQTAALPDLDFGRYHALVIGNDAYESLPRLQTAVRDATVIRLTQP